MNTETTETLEQLCQGVKFKATKGDKQATWAVDGTPRNNRPQQHYHCTFTRNGKRMHCDWWQSQVATESGREPSCADVMHSLLSDASCYEGEKDLDGFARNYCDGLGVAKTVACFNACKNRAKSVRRFWGQDYDKAQEAASQY